jgi:4-amino-4-deoxy-L-arabinose transferase-like glycosyltransferase
MNAPMVTAIPLHRRDYALLALIGIVLFGYSAISGKPLSMHEARLPQISREMLASGTWLFPTSGERPYLERPPLPHWMELAVGHLIGRLDQVWIVRLPAALMGTSTLLMVGWMTARLFGRATGLLAAIALATMYEFYFYAGQAEDEIFLAALVAGCFALFVAAEFPSDDRRPQGNTSFFGNRPPSVWAFFIILGLTNLVKGPLVGAVVVISAVGAFVFLPGERERIFRYVWFWGWAPFLLFGFAWMVAAYRVHPSILDVWKWEHTGGFGHEPVWYYLISLLWTTLPWTPAMFVECASVLAGPWRKVSRSERFVLCWAIVPLIVLTIQARKHHHYLLPILPAWGILAALGAQRIAPWVFQKASGPYSIRQGLLLVGLPGLIGIAVAGYLGKLPGPPWMLVGLGILWVACIAGISDGLRKANGHQVVGTCLVGFACFSAWTQSILGTADEYKWDDIPLAQRTWTKVPGDKPLMIEAFGSLDFFRFQFYSRPDAKLIHNITFLRDQRITVPEVYVLARNYRRKFIQEELGEYEIVDQSSRSRRETSPEERWTLFRVQFKAGLVRFPAPAVSALQALGHGTGALAGPYCGPPPKD